MTTHLDTELLRRYAAGRLGGSTAYSAEAHLVACAQCRLGLATEVDPDRLRSVWAGVSQLVSDARVPRTERVLTLCGVNAQVARLAAATASGHAGWVVAVLTTLIGAMAASQLLGHGHLTFMVLAPMAPVLGVALCYGRAGDPAWEVAQATPYGGLPLLLVRAATVLSVSTGVAAVLSLAFPEAGLLAVGWLVPSVALTALTLALSTSRAALPLVSSAVCIAWVTAVAWSGRITADPGVAFGAVGQLLSGCVLIGGIVVLIARRGSVDHRGGAW
jgi:hypothetical protein